MRIGFIAQDGTAASLCPPFSPDMEAEYLALSAPRAKHVFRLWLMMAAGMGVAMLWATCLSGWDAFYLALKLQVGVNLPAAMFLAWRLGRPCQLMTAELLFGAGVILCMLCPTIQSHYVAPLYSFRYMNAGGMALFTALLTAPMRVRQSTYLAASGFAAFMLAVLLPFDASSRTDADHLVFVALFLPLALMVRARAEEQDRGVFVLRLQDRRQREELTRVNTQLARMVETDALTGIGNRRSFDTRLRDLAREGARQSVSLLMFDVDYFKRYNDLYGHPAGDECLSRVAAALCQHIRGEGDHVARFGGEEFVVLLPGTDAETALQVAERMRQGVEALAIPHHGRPDEQSVVTVSVGLAATLIKEPDGWPVLLGNADEALYNAKRAGRNRTETYAERKGAHLLPA